MSREERERFDFERMLAERVARLTGFAKPYVGRLSPKDAEALLKVALDKAWETRKEFDPERPEEAGLLPWWEKCLRAAALTRKTWRTRTMDGFRDVPGHKLGMG